MVPLLATSFQKPVSREHHVFLVPPLRTSVDEMFAIDGCQTLARLAQQIKHAAQSDAIVVIWRDRGEDPQLVFAGLSNGSASTERELHDVAILAEQMVPTGSEPHWRTIEHRSFSAVLSTSLPADDGAIAIISLYTKASRSTHARANEAMMKLLPLVQPFFELWASRLRLLSRLQGFTDAVNSSDVPTLLIGSRGQITFRNRAAEALMVGNDGLRCVGEFLAGVQQSDTICLHSAISQVISVQAHHVALPFPVVPIHRARGRPLMVAIVASEGQARSASDIAAIVYVIDPDQDLQPLLEPTCKFYRLSPVEARLACLLTGGITLAEAAVAMKVREQTARSYLKQIFAKTDTNRQAELVRLLLTSSIRVSRRRRLNLAGQLPSPSNEGKESSHFGGSRILTAY